jgi:hypothetical protein
MELDPKDYDVVKLLTKIKNANGAYPPELLTPRRQSYLRRVAEIGLGFGVAAGLKATIKSNRKIGGGSTTAGNLIEAALVAAIVVEAGAAAYIYRKEIAEVLQFDSTPTAIVEVTSAPVTEFSPKLPVVLLTDPPDITASPLTSVTPSGTSVPSAAANDNNQEGQGAGVQSVSTPDPNGNNGNQYGLTPKPERTIGPPGDGNNNNNNNSRDR